MKPLVVCFNGLTGLRAVFGKAAGPGPQPFIFAGARVFAVPSTSRRNAGYRPEAVLDWYAELRQFLDDIGRSAAASGML